MNLSRETRWSCPNCTLTDVTRNAGTRTRFHTCKGMAGMWSPMIEDGTDCVVEAIEREDYIAGELVQVDGNGRPVSSITTRYADGHNDLAVYMPTALMNGKALA